MGGLSVSKKNNVTEHIIVMLMTLAFIAILTFLCGKQTYAETDWKACGGCEWKIDADKVLIIKPTNGTAGKLEDWGSNPPWRYNMDNIEKVKIMPGVKAVTCSNMFINLRLLTSLDVSNLDTSEVESMKGMFEGCEKITNLKLTGLSTSKATTMEGMFQRMYELEQIDTHVLNTSNVTSMKSMFRSCESLKNLNLSGFKTTETDDMTNMFDGCYKLENLNIEGFNTPKLQQTAGMFRSCGKLKKLDLKKINTARVWTMEGMFHGCGSLEELDMSNFKTSRVRWMSELFHNCSTLKSIDVSGFDMSKVETTSQMFSGCSSLKELDVSMFNTLLNKDMYAMFENCGELEKLNLGKMNTAKVTQMSSLFRDCAKLKTLNVGGLDTGEVKSMSGIFMNCASLTELNLKKLKTDKIEEMRSMFSGCRALKSLDLSGLRVPKVTSMWETFMNCASLTNIKFGTFNSVKLQFVGNAFKGCTALKSIDLSGVNTSALMSMYNMFNGCESLEKVNLGDFRTYCVNDMSGVFSGCVSLKRLDLSGFETSNVKTMEDMFKDCKTLKELDLSSFETPQLETVERMFSGCSALKSVDFGGCDSTSLGYTEDIFRDCDNLVSLNLGNFRGGETFRLPAGLKLLTVKPHADVRDENIAHWRAVGSGTARRPKGVEYENMTQLMADNEKRESGDASYVKLQNDGLGNWIVGSDTPDIEWETVHKKKDSNGRNGEVRFGEIDIDLDWDVADLLRNSKGYSKDMAMGCLYMSDCIRKGNVEQALKMLKLRDKNEHDGLDVCKSGKHEKWGEGTGQTICVRRFYRNDKPYNIITVVIRGSADIEDTIGQLNLDDVKKQAGSIVDEIEAILKENNIDVKDDDNRFLFTGHSLGGAVANLAACELIKGGCGEKNVFAYTFGSPGTVRKEDSGSNGKSNIRNIVYDRDLVTRLGIAPHLSRYGEDVMISSSGSDKREAFCSVYEKIAGKPYEVSAPAWIAPHMTEAYMALLLNGEKFDDIDRHRSAEKKAEALAERGKTARGIFVTGAVDIYVKDAGGRQVAAIESGEVKNVGSEQVEALVCNGQKVVFIKDGKGYTVELKAKDGGKTSYMVKDTLNHIEGGSSEAEKNFVNITVYKGKRMIGEVGDDTATRDLKLYVLDNENKMVREIAENGTETDIKKNGQGTGDTNKPEQNIPNDKAAPDKGNFGGALRANTGAGTQGSDGKATQPVMKLPGRVAGLKIKVKNKKKVILVWKQTRNADGYHIYRATESGKRKQGKLRFKLIKSTGKTSFSDKKLKLGGRYVYSVRAVSKIGSKTIYGKYSAKKRVHMR